MHAWEFLLLKGRPSSDGCAVGRILETKEAVLKSAVTQGQAAAPAAPLPPPQQQQQQAQLAPLAVGSHAAQVGQPMEVDMDMEADAEPEVSASQLQHLQQALVEQPEQAVQQMCSLVRKHVATHQQLAAAHRSQVPEGSAPMSPVLYGEASSLLQEDEDFMHGRLQKLEVLGSMVPPGCVVLVGAWEHCMWGPGVVAWGAQDTRSTSPVLSGAWVHG